MQIDELRTYTLQECEPEHYYELQDNIDSTTEKECIALLKDAHITKQLALFLQSQNQ